MSKIIITVKLLILAATLFSVFASSQISGYLIWRSQRHLVRPRD